MPRCPAHSVQLTLYRLTAWERAPCGAEPEPARAGPGKPCHLTARRALRRGSQTRGAHLCTAYRPDSMTTDGAGPSTSAAATPPPPPDAAPAAEPYSYVVTAHRPSAVTESLVASFTSATDINLIVSKCSRMEIHKLGQDGLQGVADVPIYGRIARICVRPPRAAVPAAPRPCCAAPDALRPCRRSGPAAASRTCCSCSRSSWPSSSWSGTLRAGA